MEERLKAIVFSDDELERILEYKEQAGAIDARVAVLNAISVASDRLEFKDEVVVRCIDCKHYDSITQSCNTGWDGIFLPDFFCADGERRADG